MHTGCRDHQFEQQADRIIDLMAVKRVPKEARMEVLRYIRLLRTRLAAERHSEDLSCLDWLTPALRAKVLLLALPQKFRDVADEWRRNKPMERTLEMLAGFRVVNLSHGEILTTTERQVGYVLAGKIIVCVQDHPEVTTEVGQGDYWGVEPPSLWIKNAGEFAQVLVAPEFGDF